jgi:hypothetical protein
VEPPGESEDGKSAGTHGPTRATRLETRLDWTPQREVSDSGHVPEASGRFGARAIVGFSNLQGVGFQEFVETRGLKYRYLAFANQQSAVQIL